MFKDKSWLIRQTIWTTDRLLSVVLKSVFVCRRWPTASCGTSSSSWGESHVHARCVTARRPSNWAGLSSLQEPGSGGGAAPPAGWVQGGGSQRVRRSSFSRSREFSEAPPAAGGASPPRPHVHDAAALWPQLVQCESAQQHNTGVFHVNNEYKRLGFRTCLTCCTDFKA